MSSTNTRNYQLQGAYTRYSDGLRVSFDAKGAGEYRPSKLRNYSTLDRAIKAAKKELRENELPKVMRFEEEVYGPRHCDRRLHFYGEDGQEMGYDSEYSCWHVDALRVVDRETQQVLWEYVVEPEEAADEPETSEPEAPAEETSKGHETTTKTTAITYEEALDYALASFCEFYDMHERINRAYEAGRGNTNLVRLMERDAHRLAAETCGQQDMLRWIYGVGEEQVHDDLAALMAQR